MKLLKSLWNYREFIWGNVSREFQSKYKNSLFGFFWALFGPLMIITTYVLVFSKLMQTKLTVSDTEYSYAIYICSGILAWGLFSEILGRSINIFIEHSNILKKLSFPRLCLPISLIIICLINFLITFFIFVVFLVLSNNFPGIVFISCVPLVSLICLIAIGLGLFLGMVNVFFRDVGQFFVVFLQLWFWCTPIVYPITILPSAMQHFIEWNPLTPIVLAFQVVFTQSRWPDWSSLGYPTLLALLFCSLGARMFKRHGHEIVDEL